ncbi:hypothetical protein O5559_27785, partial [Escherichia coli]|nr:hypothetical protein [Escherichia coli]
QHVRAALEAALPVLRTQLAESGFLFVPRCTRENASQLASLLRYRKNTTKGFGIAHFKIAHRSVTCKNVAGDTLTVNGDYTGGGTL